MDNIEFNANIKLLMGGTFCGNSSWNKTASSVDNCFKLYYVRMGNAKIIEKEKTHELNKGKLYFINGYKLDSQKSTEPFLVDWIHFLPKSLYFNYVLKSTPIVTELNIDSFSSFHSYFEQFESFFSGKSDKKESKYMMMEIQTLLYFVISKIFRIHDSEISESDNQMKRVIPALECISENYRNNLSLQELADKCCLSPNYFHRVFTDIFKVSPLNYIRDLRMDEAIRQLVYTNNPVKTVAYNVGYDDEAYFSRVFSKIYGTSPGAYRKRNNNKLP